MISSDCAAFFFPAKIYGSQSDAITLRFGTTPSHLLEFQNPYLLAHFCFQLPSDGEQSCEGERETERESAFQISVAKELYYQPKWSMTKLEQLFGSLGSLLFFISSSLL